MAGGGSVFKHSASHQVHRILTGNCPVFRHYSYTQPLAASRTQPTTWQIHLDNDVYNSIIKRHETIYSFINSDFNSNSL